MRARAFRRNNLWALTSAEGLATSTVESCPFSSVSSSAHQESTSWSAVLRSPAGPASSSYSPFTSFAASGLNLTHARFLHPAARPHPTVPELNPDQLRAALLELASSDPGTVRAITKDVIQTLKPACRADVFKSAFEGKGEGQEDLLDHVFNSVDEDKDNVLTRAEFRHAVAAYSELKDDEAAAGAQGSEPPSITTGQMLTLATAAGVPFIFFGFMDNFGMLVFGEAVDATLGVRFGLSAMASAACGNLISDVLGVSLSQVIDQRLRQLGWLKEPSLTFKQRSLPTVQRTRLMGSMVGITLGGIVGMTPLLFL